MFGLRYSLLRNNIYITMWARARRRKIPCAYSVYFITRTYIHCADRATYRDTKYPQKYRTDNCHTWALSMRSARSSSLVRLRLDTCTRCNFRRRAGTLSISSSWQGNVWTMPVGHETPIFTGNNWLKLPQTTKKHYRLLRRRLLVHLTVFPLASVSVSYCV